MALPARLRAYPPLDGIRKIAVLRPGAVGDFVFALPALHALKQTYPDASLVLLGKAWHRAFLHERPGPVDRVVVLPRVPGVGAPLAVPDGGAAGEPAAAANMSPTAAAATAATNTAATTAATAAATTAATDRAIEGFIDAMRGEAFDLALQMHGGGRYSNPFLLRCAAGLTVGACTPDAQPLDRWIAYREPTQRRLMLLEIAGLAGAHLQTLPLAHAPQQSQSQRHARLLPQSPSGPQSLPQPQPQWLPSQSQPQPQPYLWSQPELAVTASDRREAAAVVPPERGERLVVLQPGSTDPRRRWPAPAFAEIGDRLARMGARIALNGSPDERPLLDDVDWRMHQPAIRLAGRLGLGGLCGLLERAALLVSNDTGPLHLALALGVPSVGIFWLTNLIEGMPLRPSALHAALSVRTHCPVCGQDNVTARCAHDPSFVADVGIDEVFALACAALGERG
jgi:ADP-heptose:LPS heptosyltransferase